MTLPQMANPLTDRERQVTILAADGMNYRQIGEALCLSPLTVKSHLQTAREHAGADNTPHLVALALRNGWIS